MKKFGTKIVSIMLVFALLFTGASTSASAADAGEVLTKVGVTALDAIVTVLLSAFNAIVPDSKEFKDVSEHTEDYFYDGTDTFIDEAKDGASWSLGYAKASLVPSDWQTKDYYLGGFMSMQNGMVNKVEEVIDDMQVRVIAVDDGSGRGVTVIANIDCIGVSNGDIKSIRKAVEEMNLDVEFNSINISSTHTHSCIDTQGLWTNLMPKLLKNLALSYIPVGEMETGVDMEYMEFLYNKVAETIKTAVNGMTEGTMTYAVKDIGDKYFNNKNRSQSTACISEMARFVFTPYDESIDPTMMVNVAAHPDVAGLAVDEVDDGRDLSGDYIYYMGEEIENAGYNFMFVNGAIAGIYEDRGPSGDGVSTDRRYQQSERYGRELARIALNLTNSVEVIEANLTEEEKAVMKAEMEEGGEAYTLWYEGWEPVTEKTLDPILNVRISEAQIEVTNPLIQLVGKLNLVNYTVYKDGWFDYYIFAEVGYMEIGDVKIALMPGEIVQDLVAGGASLTAEGSHTGKEFGYATVYELFGDDTVCFGLMNDAIGYVVPDNDHALALIGDHYQELISLGETAGSTIMAKMAEITKEVK